MNNDQQEYREIRHKSSQGIKWQGLSEVFIRVLQFTTTIVLARLLLPQDFGLIGIAAVFIQLTLIVFDFGLNTALIQKEQVSEQEYASVFFLLLLSSLFWAGLFIALAPWIAKYFGYQLLRPIIRLLTLNFFFTAFSAIPRVKINRGMQFKRLGIAQMAASFGFGLVAVVVAWRTGSVWSFVFAMLTEQFILSVLLNLMAPWRPGHGFQFSTVKELFAFGGHVTGSRTAAYINNNTPTFLIGKLLGANVLGYYALAYQLVEFPVQRISKNVLRVMFPALSRIQKDRENYTALFLETVYYLSLILVPIFAGIWLVAPELVVLFYGSKWQPAVLPLQILTWAGLFRSFWIMNSVIFLSRGNPQKEFRLNLVFFVVLVPLILLTAPYSLAAVAAAVTVNMGVFLAIGNIMARRLVDLPLRSFLKTMVTPAIGVVLFLFVVLILDYLLLNAFAPLARFGIKMLVSMAVYGLFLWSRDRTLFGKLIRFLTSG